MTQPQNTFLGGEIASLGTVTTSLNNATAQNGYVYNQLKNATTQQGAMSSLYAKFVSNMQDTNMADAATQLSLNQTALQAALQVTSSLNRLSLLNYLPIGNGGG